MSTTQTAVGAVLGRLDAPPGEVQRETYTRTEACRAIGIGPTKFWELERAGQIKARRIGAKIVVLRSDLIAFLEGLPTEPPKSRAA